MPGPANADGESKTRHLGRGHIAALDGVRGFAVLGVMATHLFAGAQLPRYINLPLSMGVAGVDLFFVLSGFLITGILRDSLGDARYFRKFYVRRVLRIFPLYYGLILLLLLLTRPLHIAWHGVQWSLLLYLQNTHILFPSLLDFRARYINIDHLWSLAVEEQFYLVWPLVLALVRSPRRLLALCAAGMVLSLGLRVCSLFLNYGFDWMNRSTLCRADELLAGAALAILLRGPHAERVLERAKPALAISLTIALAARGLSWWIDAEITAGWQSILLTSVDYTLVMLVATALIACCLNPASRVRSAFSWKYLRSVGKYSYGLYVLHLVFLPGVTFLLLAPLRHTLHNRVLPRLLISLIVFSLSGVAAYASFHLYEKRFLRLKRFFDYDPAPTTSEA